MKALLGIERGSGHENAIRLLRQLDFPDLTVDLLHCIPSSATDSRFPDGLSEEAPPSSHHATLESEGRESLEIAKRFASEHGIQAQTWMTSGNPARALVEFADKHESNLIIVCPSPKGSIRTFLMGSTTRAVVAGANQSILVVKGKSESTNGLKAVIATDHSPYFDQCIEELIRLAPRGIDAATLVTANEIEHGVAALLVRGLPALSHEAPKWIAEKLVELSNQTAEKLKSIAPSIEIKIVDGHPNDVIHDVMISTGSELVIMGAQGHGFFHRLKFGSKSLHQVVSESYSVFILRVPSKDSSKA
ncbi:MAG: universal stress protein [Fimbriimonadales bacterium]|nr:universal stress protein [Fimbriimonadales bacterium]